MLTEQYVGRERRSNVRAIRTYKPICIETGDLSTVGLMRDISTEGVGFEADTDFKVGQELRYRWGDEPFYSGKVIWAENGRFGVANDAPIALEALTTKPYRSVRIPISTGAAIYADGRKIAAEGINVSQKGFCAFAAEQIRKGALVTLQIGNRFFEGSTAKWGENERVGFSFSRALPISEVSCLLAGR